MHVLDVEQTGFTSVDLQTIGEVCGPYMENWNCQDKSRLRCVSEYLSQQGAIRGMF